LDLVREFCAGGTRLAATPLPRGKRNELTCALLKPRIASYNIVEKACCASQHFGPPDFRNGSNSVVPVMSAARPLFPRKRTSIRDLAMSHSCQQRTRAPQQAASYSITSSIGRRKSPH